MAAPTRSAGRGQSKLRLEEIARDFIPALSGYRSAGLGKSFIRKSICSFTDLPDTI
jgi:hypothetical protein